MASWTEAWLDRYTILTGVCAIAVGRISAIIQSNAEEKRRQEQESEDSSSSSSDDSGGDPSRPSSRSWRRELRDERRANAAREARYLSYGLVAASFLFLPYISGDMDYITTLTIGVLFCLLIFWFTPSYRVVAAATWLLLVLSAYRTMFAMQAVDKRAGVKERVAAIRLIALLSYGLCVEESAGHYTAYLIAVAMTVARSVDFDVQVCAVTWIGVVGPSRFCGTLFSDRTRCIA